MLFVGVCDDESAFSRDQAALVPSGDVEGETGALGVGVFRVCAIADLRIFCFGSLAYAVEL